MFEEPPESAADPPLWRRVAASILAEMASGRLADGARLAPERAMAAGLGVAVGTLRRALADLEARGLLERRQGSGNYARHAGLGREVYGLFRLERADGRGGMPAADLLDLQEADAPEGAPFERATRIRRLRRIGDLPVAAEEIWLDRACGPLTPDDLGDSLYLTYATRLSLFVTRVEDRVGLGAMPGWAGLGGGACGEVGRRSWVGGRVVEVSTTWFDPERARYVNRAERTAPPRGKA